MKPELKLEIARRLTGATCQSNHSGLWVLIVVNRRPSAGEQKGLKFLSARLSKVLKSEKFGSRSDLADLDSHSISTTPVSIQSHTTPINAQSQASTLGTQSHTTMFSTQSHASTLSTQSHTTMLSTHSHTTTLSTQSHTMALSVQAAVSHHAVSVQRRTTPLSVQRCTTLVRRSAESHHYDRPQPAVSHYDGKTQSTVSHHTKDSL